MGFIRPNRIAPMRSTRPPNGVVFGRVARRRTGRRCARHALRPRTEADDAGWFRSWTCRRGRSSGGHGGRVHGRPPWTSRPSERDTSLLPVTTDILESPAGGVVVWKTAVVFDGAAWVLTTAATDPSRSRSCWSTPRDAPRRPSPSSGRGRRPRVLRHGGGGRRPAAHPSPFRGPRLPSRCRLPARRSRHPNRSLDEPERMADRVRVAGAFVAMVTYLVNAAFPSPRRPASGKRRSPGVPVWVTS